MAMNKRIKSVVFTTILFMANSVFPNETDDIDGFDSVVIDYKYACDDSFEVLFGNGILTEHQDALQSLITLQSQINPQLPLSLKEITTFGYIYNETDNFFADMWESMYQKTGADIKQLHRWISNLDNAPKSVRDNFIELAKGVDRQRVSSSPTTQKHVEIYNSLLSKGRKVAAVTHSQGNLFVNEAHLGIYEELKDGIGIVSVANPDDEVADESSHHQFTNTTGFSTSGAVFNINLDEDLLMRAIRFGGANFDNYYDIFAPLKNNFGHSFIDSYMDTTANLIRTAAEVIVDETIARFDKTEFAKCRTALLTAPNGVKSGSLRVLDNGNAVATFPQPSSFFPSNGELMDWRGDYKNGEATKSLSFFGPKARFIGTNNFANFIYRDGRVFYTLPIGYFVLGASMTTITSGTDEGDWVVVVASTDYKTDIVFRRRVKRQYGLDVVDLYTGLVPDAQNKDNPYWIKMAEFPHSSLSRLYAPWFFNGDGTEAQTLRKLQVKLDFSENECPTDDSDGIVCEGHDYGAGFYEVTVLNRYKISLSSNLQSASLTDLDFETDETGVLAVDYLDDKELLLRSRNTASVDVPLNQAQWLDLNGSSIMDDRILDCIGEDGAACRRGNGDTVFSANWEGLTTGWWIYSPVSNYTVREGAIDLQLYYADLRYNYFEYATMETAYNYNNGNSFLSSNGTAAYYYSYNNEDPVLMGRVDNVAKMPLGGGFATSRYGEESDYHNWISGDIATIRGQYEAFIPLIDPHPIGANAAPHLLEAGRVIEPDGSILVSNKLPDGSTFNYYSKGSLPLLAGASLDNDTVLPVGLN